MDPITSARAYDRAKKERKIVENQLAEVRALNNAKLKAIEAELAAARSGGEQAESYFTNKLAEIDAAVSKWDARNTESPQTKLEAVS
jgi:hypothetical protein